MYLDGENIVICESEPTWDRDHCDVRQSEDSINVFRSVADRWFISFGDKLTRSWPNTHVCKIFALEA